MKTILEKPWLCCGVVLAATCALTMVSAFNRFAKIRHNGELTHKFVDHKDFIADILPPPAFIVEANSLANEMVELHGGEPQKELEHRFSEVEMQFSVCIEKWSKEANDHSTDNSLSQLYSSLEQAAAPARQYFDVYHSSFLPAIHSGNQSVAQEIYEEKLSSLYKQHRIQVDRLVANASHSLDSVNVGLEAASNSLFWYALTATGSLLALLALAARFGCQAVRDSRRTAYEVGARLTALDKVQATIEFTPKGEIVSANENFLKTMGYSLEEIVGKHHRIFVDPKYAASLDFRVFWEELAAGKAQVSEFKRFAKDGREIWINATYTPILDETGKVTRIVKFASDTTLERLRKADFEGQLEAISKSQAVIEFNLEGFVQSANENFCQTLGYTLSEIKGKHHSMFVESTQASSTEYKQFWEALRAGVYQAGEFKRLGKGGREIWIQASYNPILDLNGNPFKVVKYASDITASKTQSSDFQGQVDAISKAQAVIEFNLDGTVRNANSNFLATLGYSLDEIKGKHHSMFVESAYASSPEYRLFWDNLRSGKFDASIYKRVGKGGKSVWIQASYNPIFDLNGKPYKVVKFATDITAAKEMEFAIAERKKQDEIQAAEMQQKVAEILDVVSLVSRKDYSRKLSVSGADAIGKLGEGLSKFFVDKQQAEDAEEARSERERSIAQETDRKVAVVLGIVNAVAEGDFTIDIPDLGNDAVGQVASALGSAVVAMKDALSEVSSVASTVATAAEQLSEASREISSGAQSQASSLEETASSLEEITSTVKQNSDNAQQARQLANGSRDVAERGGAVVSDAVVAMGQINEASKRISDIITTIDEIAFQTNLLALNAAVEAARAGEQGRGFAVVAAEVRNLAQRSASAAKEIKNLIQDSVSKVDNGTGLVNASGATLGEIVSSVKRVTDIVSEIAAASKEQLSGVEQVNKAVAQMDRVTQGNAAQTEEMTSTATMLLSHAKQLSDLVSGFKLDREPNRRSSHSSKNDHSGKREKLSETAYRPAPIAATVVGSLDPGVLEF